MRLGNRIQERREQLGLSQAALAKLLGVSQSSVGNYEAGISFPREEVMLRLFDCLQTDPNTLFRDSFRDGGRVPTAGERKLLSDYRSLSLKGKETLRAVAETLCAYRDEVEAAGPGRAERRTIPLYESPAAAGYAAPVFGEDFSSIPVTEDVPQAAEFAVRIQGDSMSPWIPDGSVVYVNRDPLAAGDVGIFCVDGDMYCKQYYKDPAGIVYLFSLNRDRADADLVLLPGSSRGLGCFGRVIMRPLPLPGKG